LAGGAVPPFALPLPFAAPACASLLTQSVRLGTTASPFEAARARSCAERQSP